jgi:hypothetical protein
VLLRIEELNALRRTLRRALTLRGTKSRRNRIAVYDFPLHRKLKSAPKDGLPFSVS